MAQTAVQTELLEPTTDGITALHIIDNRFLLVSSWDLNVRLFEIGTNILRSSYVHKSAVLDCGFIDRERALSGGLDKVVQMHDFTSSASTIIGTHEKAVRCVQYNPTQNLIISGSWDATIKLWDHRSNNALIGEYKQPDKVFTMSSVDDKLVVGTNGRHVMIYDIRSMENPLQKRESSLKYQTRSIRCYPNGTGYALSSIEGRVAMEYFDLSPETQARKYAFKCHRVTTSGVDTAYPVNALAFHQAYGTFATGGCDGTVAIWDGENKKRLANFTRYENSISALAFSEDGNTLAIAASYTYEEGEKDHPKDKIFIRNIVDAEVKPKLKAPPVPS